MDRVGGWGRGKSKTCKINVTEPPKPMRPNEPQKGEIFSKKHKNLAKQIAKNEISQKVIMKNSKTFFLA